MQLSGSIQGCDVVMLVDSGSSHSFLSRVVAAQLQGVAPMSKVLHVNGKYKGVSLHLTSRSCKIMI
jgi:hypothetical protein